MSRPNIILINCDDLGYGDLACYGNQLHRTPAIDRLAQEGLKLTDFYMASPVCSPSRGAMMTGSHPNRIGFHKFGDRHAVLFPGHPWGLNPEEKTIATVLKDAGYATGMVGKWHCGDQPEFLPTRHGFDSYFGLPFSNDMGRMKQHDPKQPPLPLMLNEDVLEQQPEMESLTERYAAECVRFLRANQDKPFFLYLAHLHTHLPHLVAKRFMEQSQNGEYGAAVEYVDWCVDVILKELDSLGLADNTIVIFTSDNGSRCNGEGGSNAPLRGTKHTNWEGGVRLPCLVRWPAQIPASSVSGEMTWSPDFLPTLAKLAGTAAPTDRVLDGKDVRELWTNPSTATSPHEALPYYHLGKLQAVRQGPWKLHIHRTRSWLKPNLESEPIEEICELYNLDEDVAETTNVAEQHPEVVEHLQQIAQGFRDSLGDDLTNTPGRDLRPVGEVTDPQPLTTYDPNHPYMIAEYDGPSG